MTDDLLSSFTRRRGLPVGVKSAYSRRATHVVYLLRQPHDVIILFKSSTTDVISEVKIQI